MAPPPPASRSSDRPPFGFHTAFIPRPTSNRDKLIDLTLDSTSSKGSDAGKASDSDDLIYEGTRSVATPQSSVDENGNQAKACSTGIKANAPAQQPQRGGDALGAHHESQRHGLAQQQQTQSSNRFLSPAAPVLGPASSIIQTATLALNHRPPSSHLSHSDVKSQSVDQGRPDPPHVAQASTNGTSIQTAQAEPSATAASSPNKRRQRPADNYLSGLGRTSPKLDSPGNHQITPPSSTRFDTSGPQSPRSDVMGRAASKQVVTPQKTDWTVDRIVECLRETTRDMKRHHADLVAYMIDSAQPVERRVKTGKDWFAEVKHDPVVPKDGETDHLLKIKVKHHTRGGKNTQSNNYYQPVSLKTDKPAVPGYRFHHKEIARNFLTPNTMLKFVPVIRDLNPGEDAQYNTWLKELDRMDASCGFKPMGSREQKVIETTRKEIAATLALYVDTWLDKLAIGNCNRSTLIRHMLRAESDEEITPRQKTIIDNIHSDNNQPTSPQAAKTAHMFTEAFDRVFAGESVPVERQVTLRDVLLLDKTVDEVIESKKTVKSTHQEEAHQEQVQEEPFEKMIDGFAIMGCLVCFSNSCEHGDYDQTNMKRNFSVDCNGKLGELFVKRPEAAQKKDADDTEIEPCRRECYMRLGDGGNAVPNNRPWTPIEEGVLKTTLASFECSSKLTLNAQCLVAQFLNRKCWEVHRHMATVNIELQEDNTPDVPQAKSLPWYDRHKKMLLGDWQYETRTHDHRMRIITEPCHHDGPCTEENDCECVKNKVLCERFCRCTAECCPYKFTGCACSSTGKTCIQRQKEGRPCICVQLNRECDPALCKGCGVVERAHPANREDPAIMETGCQNCVLQRGYSKALAPGKSQLEGCGYGLFTMENIAQHEFVVEYTGELIMHDEGVRREARRGEAFDEGSVTSYVFSLLDSEGLWVDAAIYGNHSRYINHEDDDFNIEPKIMYVNGDYRIRFTATRNIQAGEELFFNYGGSFPNLTKKMIKDKTQETGAEASAAEESTRRRGPGRRPDKRTVKKRGEGVRKQAPRNKQGFDNSAENVPPVASRRGRKRKRTAGDDDEDEEGGGEYHPSMEEDTEARNTSHGSSDALPRRRPGRPRVRGLPTRRMDMPGQSTGARASGVELEAAAEPSTPTPRQKKRGPGRPPKSRAFDQQQQQYDGSPASSWRSEPQGDETPTRQSMPGRRSARSLRQRQMYHAAEVANSTGEDDDDYDQNEEDDRYTQDDREEEASESDRMPKTAPAMSTRRRTNATQPDQMPDGDNRNEEGAESSGHGSMAMDTGEDTFDSADDSFLSPSSRLRRSNSRRERRLPARYRNSEE